MQYSNIKDELGSARAEYDDVIEPLSSESQSSGTVVAEVQAKLDTAKKTCFGLTSEVPKLMKES